MLFGELQPDNLSGDARNRMMQLTGDGAKMRDISHGINPRPYPVGETCNEFTRTDEPRLVSFDQLKNLQAMLVVRHSDMYSWLLVAVQNHAEELGNFPKEELISLRLLLAPSDTSRLQSKTVSIETEIVPFMLIVNVIRLTRLFTAVSGGDVVNGT